MDFTIAMKSVKMRIRYKLDLIEKKDVDLAEAIGVSKSGMSHRLSGRVEFTHSEIEKVLKFLGCGYDEIFKI